MKLKQWAQDWFAAWQAYQSGSYRTAQVLSGAAAEYDPESLNGFELTELTPSRLKRCSSPHYTRVFLFMSTNSGAVQSNSTAVFLSVDRVASLVQSLKPGRRRGSKGAAGFLGRAQIDGRAFFAYTEGKAMQRRHGP